MTPRKTGTVPVAVPFQPLLLALKLKEAVPPTGLALAVGAGRAADALAMGGIFVFDWVGSSGIRGVPSRYTGFSDANGACTIGAGAAADSASAAAAAAAAAAAPPNSNAT